MHLARPWRFWDKYPIILRLYGTHCLVSSDLPICLHRGCRYDSLFGLCARQDCFLCPHLQLHLGATVLTSATSALANTAVSVHHLSHAAILFYKWLAPLIPDIFILAEWGAHFSSSGPGQAISHITTLSLKLFASTRSSFSFGHPSWALWWHAVKKKRTSSTFVPVSFSVCHHPTALYDVYRAITILRFRLLSK